VNFAFSEEQLALRAAARDLLAVRWSAADARAALDAPPARMSADLMDEVATLGWLGIATSEAEGGSGGDLVTAAILAEEVGRALVPGPFLSALAAVLATQRIAPGSEVLAGLVGGTRRATLAVEEPGGAWGLSAVGLELVFADDNWVLDGTKILVPDAAGADLVLVVARTGDGLGLFSVPADAPGVTITPMRRLDAQALDEIVFENVRLAADACLAADDASDALTAAYDAWTVLVAADLLGTAEQVCALAVEYAKTRVQFGRPIGAFQAVSHPLANARTAVEIGRGLVYGAALALDEQRPDAGALASAAKAWTSDTAVSVTETALQVHGGIGYTWECDVHLHLRRARANAVTLGDADVHRDRVAGWLEEQGRREGRW
jgi:alkylation response protein AidB-like acyl-CoA dehydrogenase